jgi:hypothetical protein
MVGGPIICGEEVLLAECEAGTEYGAGPGRGALRRGRFASGESLSRSTHNKKGNTSHLFQQETSQPATEKTSWQESQSQVLVVMFRG